MTDRSRCTSKTGAVVQPDRPCPAARAGSGPESRGVHCRLEPRTPRARTVGAARARRPAVRIAERGNCGATGNPPLFRAASNGGAASAHPSVSHRPYQPRDRPRRLDRVRHRGPVRCALGGRRRRRGVTRKPADRRVGRNVAAARDLPLRLVAHPRRRAPVRPPRGDAGPRRDAPGRPGPRGPSRSRACRSALGVKLHGMSRGYQVLDTDSYEVLVVGSGEAGKYLAWTMAAAGHRTAVIERRFIGGSCPNIACLPSKNMIHSAKVKSLAAHGSAFGVDTGSISTDMRAVQQRKRSMVEDLIGVHVGRYEAADAELIMGNARFIAPRTVEVHREGADPQVIAGERVFLNLGTRATLPDVPGLMDAASMTHIEALELERVPEHLVVLGGGYVGLELAQA